MEWDLSPYYKGFDQTFEQDLRDLLEYKQRFTTLLEQFQTDQKGLVKKFLILVKEINSLWVLQGNLSSYCHLRLSVNSNDQEAKKNRERVMKAGNTLVASNLRCLQYFTKREGILEEIRGEGALREVLFFLEEAVAEEKHLLDPQTEEIIRRYRETGSSAWALYKNELISNHQVEIDGKSLPLTEVLTLARSADGELRKRAYEAELASYPPIEKALAKCLNGIKGEVLTTAEIKSYHSPLDMTLQESRLSPQTLEALTSPMRERLPIFKDYYDAKAHSLGKERLPWYDLLAPLGKEGKNIDYSQAQEFILDSFGSYSKRLQGLAQRAFRENWIDVFPRGGKTGGAFCSSNIKINQSRILLNYGGSVGDVITLAHELGHAYHNLCLQDQQPINRSYPMPLAETASIFCENITKDYLYSQGDDATKLGILEAELRGKAQIIVDIYSRYVFETNFFKKREEGELSPHEIKTLMIEAQKQAYGEGLDPRFLHPYMWTWKPHYYYAGRNFYNFPYAFGALYSKGLYEMYKQEGPSFQERYDAMLALTGQKNIKDVAKAMGIDVEDRTFWLDALSGVERDIRQFRKLILG